ncbi:beta-lactamase superfamily II metal-dependent hydrolase [Tumebacillus sp. BK434]|uniref:ComEC/Rec2 family competence protein n=1 Tax=Tumebacillus sp. BK434 TaxID=2512169 RepID=UPI001047CC00|nr:ComEC/Rec2 family competence protein [Tumebacillus sp. BK434]TCP58303.1 beta-lactamase superfamily II metal-dependent hydrolase [Tumebacillus sp. BK434]
MTFFRKLQRSLLIAVALILVAYAGVNVPLGDQASAATNLQVHFIDVGQADSFLVQLPNGQNMVIDAGNNADGTAVVNYLKGKGVTRVDYLIGTHPDEDHIGGLDDVIKNFTIGKLYMPNITKTTITYTDVINAAKAKGLAITQAKSNTTILSTTANSLTLKANFVAPVATSYSLTNDYSGVIRLTYGTTNFMFSGDAEHNSEADMVASGQTLSANILKVGHHGSRTSTTDAYLNKVNPSVAVISCGAGNSYGHPHAETINKLKAKGIKIFRTDQQGTIIFTTTGSGWVVNKAPWWQ